MTAWTRSRRPSFPRRLESWVLTWLGDDERLGDLGVGEAGGEHA
jgi:hypothetical protein